MVSLCAIAGCGRPAKTRGLCNGHYMRIRRGQSLAGPIGPPPARMVPDHWYCECDEPAFDGIECRRCFRAPRWAHQHYRERRKPW